MKVSAKTRYGLRLMVLLGADYDQRVVQLREIAEREEISEKYLEQIVPLLKSAQLIRSQRGSAGGYTLTRASEDITVKDIVEVLEGSLNPTDCSAGYDVCDRKDRCVTSDIWNRFGKNIQEFLSSVPLSELVEEYKSKDYEKITTRKG